jgi:hypothetical protein
MLRLYHDEAMVSQRIREIHTVPEKAHRQDILKQARQIGFCLKQAEEYFRAAESATLATRPTLLYYGVVSLSRALVLLRQDGTKSLDYVRRERVHAHHGLEIDREPIERLGRACSLPDFLTSLACRCHIPRRKGYSGVRNPPPSPPVGQSQEEQGATKLACGHFSLLYQSLMPASVVVEERVVNEAVSGIIDEVTKVCYPSPRLIPIAEVSKRRFDAFDLVTCLAELGDLLPTFDIEPRVCRASVAKTTEIFTNPRTGRLEDPIPYRVLYRFVVELHWTHQRELMETVCSKFSGLKAVGTVGGKLFYLLPHSGKGPCYGAPSEVAFPDMIADIHGRPYFLARPDSYIPEGASYLIVLFLLGMLSRYYPDKWGAALSQSVQIAEFTDTLLNLTARKYPNIILDQMTGWMHHFRVL